MRSILEALGALSLLATLLAASPSLASAVCLDPPGDVDGSGTANVVDVQCAILVTLNALGGPSPEPECVLGSADQADVNCDQDVNVSDVQLCIFWALEIELSPAVDGDGDGCPDACDDGETQCPDVPVPACGDMSGLQTGAAWPMRAYCPTRPGRTANCGPETGEIAWTYEFGLTTNAQPVIDAVGNIYLANAWGDLHAVASDGTPLWVFDTGTTATLTTPAISNDGTLVFGGDNGKLYAVDLDGNLQWSIGPGAAIRSSPVIRGDGSIVFMRSDGLLRAVEPPGVPIWSTVLPGTEPSHAAVVEDGSLWVGPVGKKLVWVSSDGAQTSSSSVGSGHSPHPAIHADGTVHSAAYVSPGPFGLPKHTDLHQFAADGTLQWLVQIGNATPESPSLAADGTVYIPVESGEGAIVTCTLVAVGSDGSIDWLYPTLDECSEEAAVDAAGRIYFPTWGSAYTSSIGELIALDSDGAYLWSVETTSGTAGFGAPAIGADGRVYVGSSEGLLYAIGE